MDLKQKLVQLQGLVGTDALSPWETGFITDVAHRVKEAGPKNTTVLTGGQVDKIEEIYENKCK